MATVVNGSGYTGQGGHSGYPGSGQSANGYSGSGQSVSGQSGSGQDAGQYGWQNNERVVPAYALTQGRTRSLGHELALETLVLATEFATRHEASLQLESQTIVALSSQPISVAEIGAALRVPIGVARVLVSDLTEAGYLIVSPPIGVDENGRPSRQILERLLDGLRAR